MTRKSDLREAILDLVEATVGEGTIPDAVFDLATDLVDALDDDDDLRTICLHVNTDMQPDGTTLCNLCGATL